MERRPTRHLPCLPGRLHSVHPEVDKLLSYGKIHFKSTTKFVSNSSSNQNLQSLGSYLQCILPSFPACSLGMISFNSFVLLSFQRFSPFIILHFLLIFLFMSSSSDSNLMPTISLPFTSHSIDHLISLLATGVTTSTSRYLASAWSLQFLPDPMLLFFCTISTASAFLATGPV